MNKLRAVLLVLVFLTVTTPVFAQPTFFYVVTTVDVNGFESGYSNQVTATFGPGQKQTNLSWTAPVIPTGGAAIAGYNVYRATTSGGPYTKITSTLVAAGVTTYVDPFVPPNAPSGLAETTS